MASYGVKIKGLDDLNAAVRKLGGEYPRILTDAMVASTTKVKNQMQEEITNRGISNTGNLRRSVFVKKATSQEGIVGVGEKYGGAVEFGTRPHFPPVEPIERWAQTKLGQKGLGFIIARKISRVGTKEQPFAKPAFDSTIDYIFDQFVQAGNRIVKALGD